ncbi:MAG: IS110 family transposase [Leptolyngbyaceae cyanobacterium CSU_1_4]|nr:IS110 family transposase [Leptolyngbyaceae cyanobacterium CSU_1_4]
MSRPGACLANDNFVDPEIDQLRKGSHSWQSQYEVLTSVPGVGGVVAPPLLAALPELESLSTKKVEALVGLAPMNFDRGKSHQGSHLFLRHRSCNKSTNP